LSNWRGIFAAPGITKAQRDELVRAVEKAVKSPSWQASLKKHDWDDFFLGGDAYGKYVEEENKRLGEILGQLSLAKK
jgi:putative tricarboxylic transport membrane protein